MSAILNASGAPQELRTPDSQPRPLTRTVGPLRREPGEPVKPEGVGRRAGAPRPTKMGTIRSPWRYDADACALRAFSLRQTATSHYVRSG